MFFFYFGAREPFDSPALEKFAQALETVQRRYSTLTLGQLSTLMRVGMTPSQVGQHVSVSDIVARSPGQKYPSIARQLDLLGEGAGDSPGLNLIEKTIDPNDRRGRYVAISTKGKDLLYELDFILDPEFARSIGRQEPRDDDAPLELERK